MLQLEQNALDAKEKEKRKMEEHEKKIVLVKAQELVQKVTRKKWFGKTVKLLVLLLIMMVSSSKLAACTSSPDHYKSMLSDLDTKRNQVLGLVASSTAASTIITALPGDTGSSVADKLADMSSYFMIILGAIFLEKILLTTSGYIVFKYGVPVVCILFIIGIFVSENRWKTFCQELAVKLLLLCVVLWGLTPASLKISSLVENTQTSKINESIDAVNNTAAALNESDANADEEQGFWEGAASKLSDWADGVTSGINEAMDTVKNSLNNLIDVIAIFIVTTCIIPLIVLVVLVVFVKWIFENIQVTSSKYVEVKNAEIKQVDFPTE